ncbi:MAG TPA: gliding motility protein GldN [Nitrosopumilaceae archaeon]|nr:gliding motility protein GldN [Nitrosopumilaceae archaeon]
MKIKAFIICLVGFLSFNNGFAQVFQPGDYRDGIYDKENSTNRKFIPYTFLREADVNWEKRVWRKIDLREKINHPLYYPTTNVNGRISLFQVLISGIKKGEVMAFQDDEFLVPYNKAEIIGKLVDSVKITESNVNAAGESIDVDVIKADSTGIFEKVLSYAVKEDWFFDKQKSVMEVRIIGIAPQKFDPKIGEGINMFWVYFPACRPLFAANEVFNTKNDAERRTYDDIFLKRQFSSFVTKETNVYDRNIVEYAHGIDAQLESDRIKKDIFLYEHDLWHF